MLTTGLGGALLASLLCIFALKAECTGRPVPYVSKTSARSIPQVFHDSGLFELAPSASMQTPARNFFRNFNRVCRAMRKMSCIADAACSHPRAFSRTSTMSEGLTSRSKFRWYRFVTKSSSYQYLSRSSFNSKRNKTLKYYMWSTYLVVMLSTDSAMHIIACLH